MSKDIRLLLFIKKKIREGLFESRPGKKILEPLRSVFLFFDEHLYIFQETHPSETKVI